MTEARIIELIVEWGVEEVLVIGRRGPLQATFTTLELRELHDLEAMTDVDVIVDPADFARITDEDLEAAGKATRQNIKVMRGYADVHPANAKRRIIFRFQTSPIEITGTDRVEGIVLGRNELVTDADGRVVARDTGEREELPAQLVIRAVGYRQAWRHLAGDTDATTFREQSIAATSQLAKRQYTWLRGELDARWFDPVAQRDRLDAALRAFVTRCPHSCAACCAWRTRHGGWVTIPVVSCAGHCRWSSVCSRGNLPA